MTPEPEEEPTTQQFIERPAPAYTTPHGYFPFPVIRGVQQRAMDAWMNAMAKDKRYAVFELPTGVGKSPLSFAIGSWAAGMSTPDDKTQAGAYILTTQKSLQQQYLRDFADKGMVELRGAANYACATHKTDCSAGAMMNRANKALLATLKPDDPKAAQMRRDHPTGCGSCPYKEAKEVFMGNPLGVTSFAYLLSEAAHVHHLPQRSLLIIDEAHNTESQLLGFVELEITEKRCQMVGSALPPRIQPGDVTRARAWCLDEFLPKLELLIRNTQEMSQNEGDAEVRRRLLAKVSGAEQFMARLKFLADAQQLDEWFAYSDEKTGALKLRPLTARSIAQDFLFRMGHKMLFLSATILDGKSFIRGLGLNGSEGGFLRVDSDFPVENRLITLWGAGSMAYKSKDVTIPRLVRYVEKVLNKHVADKGLIHTNSYQLTTALVEYLQTTKHAPRLIYHDSIPGSRDAAIQRHVTSEEPTVLISPSMTEGLDLAEDLSRFQVLCKVPYPFLGDPFVKARMAHDEDWYRWQTALTLIQATGRSVRSSSDTAATYLLDSDFERFLREADSILPSWWKKAIIYK